VYLHRDLAGQFVQDDGGQHLFTYAESYLKKGLLPLSHSLPFRAAPFTNKECRGFFSGILPEGDKREKIARNLGISARNDFAMLEQIGGECAGAVSFMPAGAPLPESDNKYRKLSESELAAIIQELPRRPLLAGKNGVRMSLAGAQDKLAVHVAGGDISLPLNNAPSTHILKPANPHYEGVVFNEALCMRLAAAAGLPVAAVETRRAGEFDYLLVERYDRRNVPLPFYNKGVFGFAGSYNKRLHQEDFCQALGIPSENKYQIEGGPSLKMCFDLLREVSRTPVLDIQRFLDAVIFNFLIGNNDAHGKNFSFTYGEYAENTILASVDVEFAPLYDILCTTLYPELTPEMAMKIGGESQSGLILPEHFEMLAQEAGLGKPLVRNRVPELARAVMAGLEKSDLAHKAAQAAAALIGRRCANVIEDFKSG
jgi:serine/threonine-protein kinase HipA